MIPITLELNTRTRHPLTHGHGPGWCRVCEAAQAERLDNAMMQFAGNVADSASQITESDVNDLRSHGFSDPEIFDIAATAAARSFIPKLMDSLGVQPDSHYASLPESVKGALVVGRPIEVSD